MNIAMTRVGVDSGAGKIQGPLFKDSSFEYIPIPDEEEKDGRTYGNTVGRLGRKLIDYFPDNLKRKYINQSIHFDPEFDTFTYGDPTRPKARLRELEPGNMLIFYCGLEGWDHQSPPGLYLLGYFEVQVAGKANDFSSEELESLFSNNFHVKHRDIFEQQKQKLVLVKGSPKSRLLQKALCISVMGHDRSGRPLKVLSPEMQKIFGDFDGKICFQRSPTRWIVPEHTARAADYMRAL